MYALSTTLEDGHGNRVEETFQFLSYGKGKQNPFKINPLSITPDKKASPAAGKTAGKGRPGGRGQRYPQKQLPAGADPGKVFLVLTDVVQTAIIAVGVPILAVVMLVKYTQMGGSIGSIFATPFIPDGMGTRFVYLVLPFLLSISVSYDAYSRIQSAKDARTARLGCIFGGILVIIVGGLCSTIGVAARDMFPGVTDGIFTIAATGVLPPVLAGIVIAAILAAAMSSANCVILSMGASFARDFYNKFLHPEVENLDELPKSKIISQATVFLGSLAGIFFAFHMTDVYKRQSL